MAPSFQHPELFESLGVAQPKGVLLYGKHYVPLLLNLQADCFMKSRYE